VQALEAATRKIGLDLPPLRIEEIETALAAEKIRAAMLDARLQIALRSASLS